MREKHRHTFRGGKSRPLPWLGRGLQGSAARAGGPILLLPCELSTFRVLVRSRSNARRAEKPNTPVSALREDPWLLIVPEHMNLLSGLKPGKISLGGQTVGDPITDTNFVP